MTDILEMLQSYKVEKLKVHGDQAYFCCPFHNDVTPSASMNIKLGVFNCFACGVRGNLAGFIARIENITLQEAQEKVEVVILKPEETNLIEELRKLLLREEKATFLDEKILTTYTLDYPESFLKRGIPLKTLVLFEIKYSKKDDCIIIPIRDTFGRLIALKGRAITPTKSKYRTLEPRSNFKKSECLYGLHLCKEQERLIICEGEFDCISFYANDIPGAVAIMGSSLSSKQEQLIETYGNSVILALDNDSAGKKAQKKIAHQLMKKGIGVKAFKYFTEQKDPGELSKENLRKGVENAEIVSLTMSS